MLTLSWSSNFHRLCFGPRLVTLQGSILRSERPRTPSVWFIDHLSPSSKKVTSTLTVFSSKCMKLTKMRVDISTPRKSRRAAPRRVSVTGKPTLLLMISNWRPAHLNNRCLSHIGVLGNVWPRNGALLARKECLKLSKPVKLMAKIKCWRRSLTSTSKRGKSRSDLFLGQGRPQLYVKMINWVETMGNSLSKLTKQPTWTGASFRPILAKRHRHKGPKPPTLATQA